VRREGRRRAPAGAQVINALLGGKFLADGILPTTNEISVLKFRRARRAPAPPLCQWQRHCASALCAKEAEHTHCRMVCEKATM